MASMANTDIMADTADMARARMVHTVLMAITARVTMVTPTTTPSSTKVLGGSAAGLLTRVYI